MDITLQRGSCFLSGEAIYLMAASCTGRHLRLKNLKNRKYWPNGVSLSHHVRHKSHEVGQMMMMMMMKLPILPCAEKLDLVLSTAPKT